MDLTLTPEEEAHAAGYRAGYEQGLKDGLASLGDQVAQGVREYIAGTSSTLVQRRQEAQDWQTREALYQAIFATVLGHTGGCTCDPAYSERNLVDPDCVYCYVGAEELSQELASKEVIRRGNAST